MKISLKTQYALRAIVALAQHKEETSLSRLAKEENIPQEFLEKIMQTLKKSKLVRSTRGANGGYALNRSAKEMTAADIVSALEKPLSNINCIDNEPSTCPHEQNCKTQKVWHKVEKKIMETLQEMTIDTLCKK
ncbi:MAG: Rrf2 family transcriptional regulator [Candidatus Moranbacteria bacterium]|nr:Rrf2 family transcriptional regulator [Candidatus Moranbacteria bacterium]